MYIARVTCLQFNGSGGIVRVSLAARGVSDVGYAPVNDNSSTGREFGISLELGNVLVFIHVTVKLDSEMTQNL